MARTRVTQRNNQQKRPTDEHPIRRHITQQFMMNENNQILHEEEEEEHSDEQPDDKQAAETQQPSPPPIIERHAKKKKAIEHSVSIASVMEEIRREAESNSPSQSPAVASLPASAGNNSTGSRSRISADNRQQQGGSTCSSNYEEHSDDGDNQGQDDDEEETETSGLNDDDNIDEDTARTEKYLRLYFHSLAKSGTIRTVEEEYNLVTAKLGQVFKCQKFIISNRDLSEQGLIAQIMFQEMEVPDKFRDVWWEEMKSHVRKKMDERRSNCGTSVKKGLLGT